VRDGETEMIKLMKTSKKYKREVENKEVSKIVSEIVALEQKYLQSFVRRACNRYTQAISEKNKAEKKIKVLEAQLSQAKSKLK
jgi:hypothetical protein